LILPYIQKKDIKINSEPLMLSMNCECPCGGGQSCIVDRRSVKDWVHEDDVFLKHKLPLRKNCYQQYTNKQLKVLNALLVGDDNKV